MYNMKTAVNTITYSGLLIKEYTKTEQTVAALTTGKAKWVIM